MPLGGNFNCRYAGVLIVANQGGIEHRISADFDLWRQSIIVAVRIQLVGVKGLDYDAAPINFESDFLPSQDHANPNKNVF